MHYFPLLKHYLTNGVSDRDTVSAVIGKELVGSYSQLGNVQQSRELFYCFSTATVGWFMRLQNYLLHLQLGKISQILRSGGLGHSHGFPCTYASMHLSYHT